MLNNKRQNFHHSHLPNLGEIGNIVGLSTVNPKRKCIVESFPLNDSADPRYSVGIHTINVRFLDNQDTDRFSAIWFQN